MICGSLFKTLLWITNFVLFAAGAFLIGAGIYVYSEMKAKTINYLMTL